MPVVGIVSDRRLEDDMPIHLVHDEYVVAVRDGAGALPLMVPSTDAPLDAAEVLAAVDGLLFTGNASNVAPRLYGDVARPGTLLDETRDATILPLLQAAIAVGKPVLCICRGFQELNVALGGSLYQHIQEIPGRLDHRADHDAPLSIQYGPAHGVTITPDGLLARLGAAPSPMVNSLHAQGIDRLAPGLAVEAVAPDGQIEAVSLPGAKAFLLAVQWHPEWNWAADALSRVIWSGFGGAMHG